MGMTMTQKILASHAGLASVKAGDLVEAKLDLVLGNDVTTPVAVEVFEDAGLTKVFDKDKIAIVLDHYTPCKDIASANLCATARAFAKKHEMYLWSNCSLTMRLMSVKSGSNMRCSRRKVLSDLGTASSALIPIPALMAHLAHFPLA